MLVVDHAAAEDMDVDAGLAQDFNSERLTANALREGFIRKKEGMYVNNLGLKRKGEGSRVRPMSVKRKNP